MKFETRGDRIVDMNSFRIKIIIRTISMVSRKELLEKWQKNICAATTQPSKTSMRSKIDQRNFMWKNYCDRTCLMNVS